MPLGLALGRWLGLGSLFARFAFNTMRTAPPGGGARRASPSAIKPYRHRITVHTQSSPHFMQHMHVAETACCESVRVSLPSCLTDLKFSFFTTLR